MAISLLDLPPELVVRIASFLTTAELGPLRRSCKKIENDIFDSFAQEFFTKRQFMIEHESLEALVGIANHPGLASRLTEVLIGTEILNSDTLLSKRFLEGYVDQDALLNTGLGRDLLSEAFSKLPNLRKVGLRDYSGLGRDRDGEHARWRSWGWSLAETSRASSRNLFPVILSALGVAKAKPANIEVFLRQPPHLSRESFLLPRGSLLTAIASVLGEVKTLMLAVSVPGNRFDPERRTTGAPWLPYGLPSIEIATLQSFLHHTSALEHLRVNFQPFQFIGFRFLEWLSNRPAPSEKNLKPIALPVPPIQLAHLVSLELGMLNVPGPVLLRAICRFDLHTLSLWKTILHCPGPNNISRDCWAEFFEQLAKSLSSSTRLRTIMIGHVTQDYFHGPDSLLYGPKVSFVPAGTASDDKAAAAKLDQVKFQGQFEAQDARQWLHGMSNRTFVPGIHTTPEPVGPVGLDSDQDSGDEEDGEDENMEDDDDDADDE